MTASRSSRTDEVTKELAGKYVELYDFHRPTEVRWKGIALPSGVFNKEQRVTHTAVVEDKRLGHALVVVKAQQDRKQEADVLTNSEKTGNKERPRSVWRGLSIFSKRNRQSGTRAHLLTARLSCVLNIICFCSCRHTRCVMACMQY